MTELVLDAVAIARLLEMSPQRFMALFKRGLIHQHIERGVGNDAGRFRITLSHLGRRIAVVVSADGTILEAEKREK